MIHHNHQQVLYHKLEKNTDELLSKHNVYKRVGLIYRYICILDDLTTNKVDENNKPSPDWTRIAKEGTSVIKSLQAALSDVDVEKNSGQLRVRVSLICNEAISVCTELQNISKNLTVSSDDSKVVNLVSRVTTLKIEAQTLDAEARKGLGTNPLDMKSPYLSQVPAQSTSTSVAQAAAENARYRTKLAKETLKDAKLRQDKSYDSSIEEVFKSYLRWWCEVVVLPEVTSFSRVVSFVR